MSGDRWEVFDERLPFAGALYGPQRARMVVIGIGGGRLLVVSPGLSKGLFDEVGRWGTPAFLLAPNHFHNAGIATWKARWPEARAVAHPRAIRRLEKQVPRVAFEELSALETELPKDVRLFAPPMAKQGETMVSLRTSAGTAWFVTDAIVNEERLPGGLTGLVVKAVGFRTRLMTNPLFKRIFLRNKAAYKAWVRAELERDHPQLFVPAHGAVLRGATVESRLRAVTDEA